MGITVKTVKKMLGLLNPNLRTTVKKLYFFKIVNVYTLLQSCRSSAKFASPHMYPSTPYPAQPKSQQGYPYVKYIHGKNTLPAFSHIKRINSNMET